MSLFVLVRVNEKHSLQTVWYLIVHIFNIFNNKNDICLSTRRVPNRKLLSMANSSLSICNSDVHATCADLKMR
eukprot:SAG31_NODE_484_length_15037_cov_9.974762_6_plen_73_part_00